MNSGPWHGRGRSGGLRGRGRGGGAAPSDRSGSKRLAGQRITGLVRLQDGGVYTVSSDKRSLRRRSFETTTTAVSQSIAAQARAARKIVSQLRKPATAAAFERKRLASAAVAQSRRVSQRSRAAAAAAKSRQKKKTCLFFNRFGRCDKMGKGCPYAHDPSKVAVCRRFLRGTCHTPSCPFSHEISPDKMPVCFHFLRGACGRENCPYLHKKHGANTPVCDDFLKGHCSKGRMCDKRHVIQDDASAASSVSATPDSTRGVLQPVEEEVALADTNDVQPPASFLRFWERTGATATYP